MDTLIHAGWITNAVMRCVTECGIRARWFILRYPFYSNYPSWTRTDLLITYAHAHTNASLPKLGVPRFQHKYHQPYLITPLMNANVNSIFCLNHQKYLQKSPSSINLFYIIEYIYCFSSCAICIHKHHQQIVLLKGSDITTWSSCPRPSLSTIEVNLWPQGWLMIWIYYTEHCITTMNNCR